jgi:hypothetical protein
MITYSAVTASSRTTRVNLDERHRRHRPGRVPGQRAGFVVAVRAERAPRRAKLRDGYGVFHGGVLSRRGPGRSWFLRVRARPAQSGIFRTTPLLTCTFGSLGSTALPRPYSPSASTSSASQNSPLVQRLACPTQRRDPLAEALGFQPSGKREHPKNVRTPARFDGGHYTRARAS